MRKLLIASAITNLALRLMFVVLNTKLIAPTTPAMSVTGPERQFAFFVLAAGEEGFALIFLIGSYFLHIEGRRHSATKQLTLIL